MSAIDEARLLDEAETLTARLGGLIEGLDADALTPATAVRLVGVFARAGKHAAAGETLAARRVDASKAYVAAGYRSTEQLVAAKSGTGPAQASKVVETGRRLGTHAETAAALRKGQVSIEQAHVVTSAAEADPGAETELLEFAGRESLRRLETKAREMRLAADDDRVGRYARQRAARRVWHGIDDEGMGWGRWRLPPDEHVAAVNCLERQADREYRAADCEGRRAPHGCHLADALVTLCTRCGGDDVASRDPRSEVVFHVDLAAAARGTVEPGERCMVRGGGPVPVDRVQRAVAEGAFVKVVLRDGTDIRTVKHFGRRRPAELVTALEARAVVRDGDVICDEDGCDQTLGLEWDHIQPVSADGPTSYENLKPRCRSHHREKTARDRRAARTGPDPP
jgi:hypothetical protein